MTHNVTKTAKILGCSRTTVYKWLRAENLCNRSRAPKKPRRKISDDIIELIKQERIKTNYGRRRLKHWLSAKYSIFISENTIAYYLRKFKLSKPSEASRLNVGASLSLRDYVPQTPQRFLFSLGIQRGNPI